MTDPGPTPAVATNSASSRPTNVRWIMLLLLMATAGMAHFNRISMASAGTEQIIPNHGISEPQMGMIYSSFLFVYTFCMLPFGWVLDRYGPRTTLLILGFGSALLVPMTGIVGLALPGSLFISLCLIRGTLGMINAPLHPGAARAVSFWMPPAFRGTANGLVTAAAVAGIAMTPFAFGMLMDQLGWQYAFAASGVLTLILAAAWAWFATDYPTQHPWMNDAERHLYDQFPEPVPRTSSLADLCLGIVGLFRHRHLLLVTLSYAAYSYVQYLFFYWQQQYFKDVLQLNEHYTRLFSTIVLIAMSLGMLSGGWFADLFQVLFGVRRGRIMIPITGMLVCAVLLVLGVLTPTINLVLSCFAVAMFALGACEAPFWVTAVELGGRRGGLSGAFLNTIGNVGGIVAPVVTPFFSVNFGWQSSLILASCVSVVGALIWLWIDPQAEHIDHTPVADPLAVPPLSSPTLA